MKYPGLELEVFEKAIIWRAYVYIILKKFIKKNVLEIGAGLGSFTKFYLNSNLRVTVTDLDKKNYEFLKKRFKGKRIIITNKKIKNVKKKYDTILYMNVLEHIKDDRNEVLNSMKMIKTGGRLIFLVPAHQKLFSKFDKEIGHFRRYSKNFFNSLKLKDSKIEKLFYLDSSGYLLYFLNKLFFKNETYPTKFKIFIWDKIFTPISLILDWFLNYKVGKNIICIIKKN
jgi:SAM-dependent methyltransferase